MLVDKSTIKHEICITTFKSISYVTRCKIYFLFFIQVTILFRLLQLMINSIVTYCHWKVADAVLTGGGGGEGVGGEGGGGVAEGGEGVDEGFGGGFVGIVGYGDGLLLQVGDNLLDAFLKAEVLLDVDLT